MNAPSSSQGVKYSPKIGLGEITTTPTTIKQIITLKHTAVVVVVVAVDVVVVVVVVVPEGEAGDAGVGVAGLAGVHPLSHPSAGTQREMRRASVVVPPLCRQQLLAVVNAPVVAKVWRAVVDKGCGGMEKSVVNLRTREKLGQSLTTQIKRATSIMLACLLLLLVLPVVETTKAVVASVVLAIGLLLLLRRTTFVEK